MIAALDVGNTNISCGIFRGDKLVFTFRVATDMMKTEDEYGVLFNEILRQGGIKRSDIKGFCISCVVPPLLSAMETMIKKCFKARVVVLGPGVKTGMPVLYDSPKDVGADRIANAVGAWRLYRDEGRGMVVIDLGTATTFDCISEKGEYLGGVIVPGLMVSLEALFTKAAKLPKIEVHIPDRVIGRNTVHSMQSGVVFGHAAMIDGMVNSISKEMKTKPVVVATGGYVSLVVLHAKSINVVDENITFFGLKFIFEQNVKCVE